MIDPADKTNGNHAIGREVETSAGPADKAVYSEEDFAYDGQALHHYQHYGAASLHDLFTIANILHLNRHVSEAARFYKIAYQLHPKSHDVFPLAQSLLQASLLCQLKAGVPPDAQLLVELFRLNAPFGLYITGVSKSWRTGQHEEALDLMQNCYEEFHTGEEADLIYLEIALKAGCPVLGRDFSTNTDHKKVPENIYLFWNRNPPAEVQSNFDRLKECFGERIHIFDDSSASEWLYQNYGPETRSLFLNARHPAEAADFLRVHVIYLLGGWWLDADITVKDPNDFATLVHRARGNVLILTDNNVVHNDFFGAAPGSVVLSDCMVSLYRNSYLHKSLFIAFKTGPGIFNRALCRIINRHRRGYPMSDFITILDYSAFSRYIVEIDAPYKASGPTWHIA